MHRWFRMIAVGAVTVFAGGCLGVSSSETPLVENVDLRSVSVGGFHACALSGDGAVYCWGLNGTGQLGDQTLNNRSVPVRVAAGDLTFASVTAGGGHTCALTATGEAHCWGANFEGQLGDGDLFGQRASPVRVMGDLQFDVLSAGGTHTCGVTIGGEAYCWGSETSGQLGNGVSGPSATGVPQALQGDLSFTSISAGATHACGVTQGGAAYCWGAGLSGQLGNGATGSAAVPTAVAGDLVFTEVSAGGEHTCGITQVGDGYCWGDGASGQLGNGTKSSSASPVQVQFPIGDERLFLRTMSAGGRYTCAIVSSGALCWGLNDAGQLGDGTTTTRDTPVEVPGGLPFIGISAGIPLFAASTCGIKSDLIVYCWGSGQSGQLGNGANAVQLTPVQVAGQN